MASQRLMPLLFIFLLILPNLLPFLAALHVSRCNGLRTYTSNRTYKTNLHALLSTLPATIDRPGFFNASFGQPPDRVNAVVLCRGDVGIDACRQCVSYAAAWLTDSECRYQKQAIAWFQDSMCTLRYSDETIVGINAMEPLAHRCNARNSTSPDQFHENLKTLLNNLTSHAVNGGSRRKFDAGNVTGPDLQTIYALVQCTPDLSRDQCGDCFSNAVAQIPSRCPWRRGGRILTPSCSVRYETYSFFTQVNKQEEISPDAAAPAIPVPPPLVHSKDDADKTRVIIIVVASITLCAVLAAFIITLIKTRRKQKPTQQLETTSEIGTTESLQYTFSTIRAATNEFSDDNKLGQGGFGAVYKGTLPNGREVAVKRLSKDSGQGSVEFQNEVLLLTKLLHRNLVRLLGFCLEGTEKLLVYELVPNGSLDRFIYGPHNHSCLDWDKRLKILWGIARGLLYLHEDSQMKIIHRDLKLSNVLLDGEMIPKIADFGLAKLFEQDETQANTLRIVGTYGYMSPEYAINGQYSVKSDVYSFGVLVLEIISGRKNTCFESQEEYAPNLSSFVWKRWRDGAHESIVDPFLRSESNFMSDMLRCIHIGLLCVQRNPADRPTMASVVIMLRSCSVTMALPSQPGFYFGTEKGAILSPMQIGNSLQDHMRPVDPGEKASENEASTITRLSPR